MAELENPSSHFQITAESDSDPLRPSALSWNTYSDQALTEWYQLLATDPEEPEVQAFLELHPSMIPGGSGDVGPGGHHLSEMGAVFRLPTLDGEGHTYVPDFMWVTHSSGMVTPILIEIEKPSKPWFNPSNGRPSATFTAAFDQLNDWIAWFKRDGNPAIFRKKYLFDDRFNNRPLVPQFLLIYGRESEFTFAGPHKDPDALRYKRDQQAPAGVTFRSYDSLKPNYGHANSITMTMTANGPRPFAFSPMYGTGPETGPDSMILGDASDALARSVMMSETRKAYLEERWNFWNEAERKLDSNKTPIRSMGRE